MTSQALVKRHISYHGGLKDGKRHGFGILFHFNGAFYTGNWKEGKCHGRGFGKYTHGGTYHGEWCEDLPHGRGLYKFVDGDSYDGEWIEGLYHGRGLYKYVNGSSYDGEWYEGNEHGRGVLKYANGDSYIGEWRIGKLRGRGLYKYADGSSYDGEWCEDKRHGRGLYKDADGNLYYGKWINDIREYGNDLRIVIQDNSGLKRNLTLPADSKISAIFSAYEITTGKSHCRLKHKEQYIFYSQSKKESLKHFGICNDDVITVEMPVLSDMSNNHMANDTATSSFEKPKVSKTKRQPSRQRRPWAGRVMDSESDRVKHSRQMNLVLNEIQPKLEQIRQHLNDLTLERTRPKDRGKTSNKTSDNLEQVECRPDLVGIGSGIGSKAGKGSFVVNVGEANNLYKTSKHSKMIRSNPAICLDLHELTKEQALAALNDSLPTWIETANSGVYPFVIQVRIVCGKGSQTLSEVVMQWINSQQQVAHAPKQKQ
eukprot:scaffold312122_cov46-Cyclotella_meneghiniana.AAC.1